MTKCMFQRLQFQRRVVVLCQPWSYQATEISSAPDVSPLELKQPDRRNSFLVVRETRLEEKGSWRNHVTYPGRE